MSCRPELVVAWMLLAGSAIAASPPEENASPSVAPPASAEASASASAPADAVPATQPAAQENSTDFRAKAHEYKSAAGGFHKPSGEITVTADHVEWQTGAMHYTGNVKLTVDTMELTGIDLELKLLEGRLQHAHLTGEPAHMVDNGTEGQPPISAQAKKVDYEPGTAIVELAGAAQLMRGADRLTGELIRYDVSARRVQAAGSSGSQVKIVIQPPKAPNP